MGTKGLISYIQKKGTYSYENKEKKKAVIDGKNFMHLLYDSIMFMNINDAFNKKLIHDCLDYFLKYLKSHNIIVTHIIFDGVDDIEKDKEKMKRKKEKLSKNLTIWNQNMKIENPYCHPTPTLWFDYQVINYFLDRIDIMTIISGVDADRYFNLLLPHS